MSGPLLVTGGAGFIGGHFVRHWLDGGHGGVVNLDKLTYAASPAALASVAGRPDYIFAHGDICDRALVAGLLAEHRPAAIVHFAAESHVDRSIHGPDAFLRTNVEGTFALLEQARAFWNTLDGEDRARFRFLHVSTDEVYGTLGPEDPAFTETTAYAPNSPYAATKASSDLLARAWFYTFGLPVVITNCSNNYGPFQFPEKLIPLMIAHALAGKPLPLYGDGLQVRDWLYVEDHCRALEAVLAHGRPGETYNIGGGNQRTNREVVETLCALLDERVPASPFRPHAQLMRSVTDRPGHDRRYAIDAGKIERELGWRARETFATGLRRTVAWYLEHGDWVESITSGSYRTWIETNYSQRPPAVAGAEAQRAPAVEHVREAQCVPAASR